MPRWAPGAPAAASLSPGEDRDESQAERDDRNLAELLQELRVAGLGVQVLFGFLLSLPFTNRFANRFATLSHAQRQLYIVTLMPAPPARPAGGASACGRWSRTGQSAARRGRRPD